MGIRKYLVGWCPDCARVSVVLDGDDATCGCGHELLSLTSCDDISEVARAVDRMEAVMDVAFGRLDRKRHESPSLDEVTKECRDAAEAMRDEEDADGMAGFLFTFLHDAASRIEADDRKMYRFMVAPSPFQVSVVAASEDEALTGLLENFHEVAVEAFEEAIEADDLDVTILPFSGDRTWHHHPSHNMDD